MPRQFGKVDGSTTWACERCKRPHQPGSSCPPTGIWLDRRTPASQAGVVWLKRPMPPDQWPRDPAMRWWIRSHCGHQGGARQWAFYTEADADLYEHIFRADPCHYARCRNAS